MQLVATRAHDPATDNAPRPYDVREDEDSIPHIPWWAWLASAALMAVCYAANGGKGVVAFLAGAGLCRFLIAPRLTRVSSTATIVSVALALVGFFIFLLAWMALDRALGWNSFSD